MAKVVMDRRFVCVCSQSANAKQQGNNKFWTIKVTDDGIIRTVNGRMGTSGQVQDPKDLGSESAALVEAEKLIGVKLRGKKKGTESVYKEVEVVSGIQGSTASGGKITSNSELQRRAMADIGAGDPKVDALIKHFVQTNQHAILSNTDLQYDDDTGLFATPLGVIGQTGVDRARVLLGELSVFSDAGKTTTKKAIQTLDEFLMVVPQSTGREKPSMKLLLPDSVAFGKQDSLLDSLQASLDTLAANKAAAVVADAQAAGKKVAKNAPKVWDVAIRPLADKAEIARVKSLFKNSMNRGHQSSSLQVANIYIVDHVAMRQAFEKKGKPLGNVKELWHGTRAGNILSILAKGFYIPPSSASNVTGRMFGNGVYGSDQSTKALNYAQGYWGGGSRDDNCFMFLMDFAMGREHLAKRYGSGFPVAGSDSTFARGGGGSGVANNEMIVYKTHQLNPNYLVEFQSR